MNKDKSCNRTETNRTEHGLYCTCSGLEVGYWLFITAQKNTDTSEGRRMSTKATPSGTIRSPKLVSARTEKVTSQPASSSIAHQRRGPGKFMKIRR